MLDCHITAQKDLSHKDQIIIINNIIVYSECAKGKIDVYTVWGTKAALLNFHSSPQSQTYSSIRMCT